MEYLKIPCQIPGQICALLRQFNLPVELPVGYYHLLSHLVKSIIHLIRIIYLLISVVYLLSHL